MLSSQNHAEVALYHLIQAVLGVLDGDQWLGPKEIRLRAGIPEALGGGSQWGFFMSALLEHMAEQGLVEYRRLPRGRVWHAKTDRPTNP